MSEGLEVLYDAKLDPTLEKGYIDTDETRKRTLQDGRVISYRYQHGGFEGTDIRFSFCFPEAKEDYKERFFQYLSPFPGPQEELASLPVEGPNDKVGFALTHGAGYIESNMGSKMAFANSPDRTMTHRSSALTAEFCRRQAQKVYGYEHYAYVYVYGGSGGGYRTIACMENTVNFDGAAPHVIGSPYAIPNCQSTRAHAERLLRNKMAQVIDARDPGGSGDPYPGLTKDEADALREAELFGYPYHMWWASRDLDDGALPVLLSGIKRNDPTYFTDFWTKPGYLGYDPEGTAAKDRIQMETAVTKVCGAGEEAKDEDGIDTRNGVNDAWKKQMGKDTGEQWIDLADPITSKAEDLYLKGLDITVKNGEAAGLHMGVGRVEGKRVFLQGAFGSPSIEEILGKLQAGDVLSLDNSDYIAVQTYHRHQVPSPDYHAWDQFRDENGEPLYPQRGILQGPMFSSEGPGCYENGRVNCKFIIVAALNDEQAYPWQADWYRRKVETEMGIPAEEVCRLYYFENATHGEPVDLDRENHMTSYEGGLRQSLLDLSDWVQKGIEPLPSSVYTVEGGRITPADTAKERCGIQPTVSFGVRKSGDEEYSDCVHVKAGETVEFIAKGAVPDGAGALTFVNYSFEDEPYYPNAGEWTLNEDGTAGTSTTQHIYNTPGTYFACVRVKSEKSGSREDFALQMRNIGRARVVVEEA